MKEHERRRYFRINETVGLSIQMLDEDGSSLNTRKSFAPNAIELVSRNDDRIEHLLDELQDNHPKVIELVSLLNQKIERVSSLLALESNLLDRIAHRVQEVNISACGLAFSHEDPIPEGSRIRIEMTLYPEETKLRSEGIVIACELTGDEPPVYYCRVDFFNMAPAIQEELIQFIVQSQSVQLKDRQNSTP